MDIMTHAKFYFNRLMLTLIFAIRASEPPPPVPGERLKRPGLIGLSLFRHGALSDKDWSSKRPCGKIVLSGSKTFSGFLVYILLSFGEICKLFLKIRETNLNKSNKPYNFSDTNANDTIQS